MDASGLTLGLAFFAGLASFLSPCVFALVPAYVGYLSGRTAAATNHEEKTGSLTTVLHGFAFVAGFSLVFILLGALAAALRGLLFDITAILVKVGGVVIVIFGLHMLQVIRIPFLNYDLRPQNSLDRQRGYFSSALMGVFFSAGWSPCVGPILGTILTVSLNGGDVVQGATMLTAYSAGLGIPFLLAAAQIGWVTTTLRRYGRVMLIAERVMGVVLIAVGVLLFSGRFASLASLGFFFDNFDEVLVGRLLLLGLFAAVMLGLIPAVLARQNGRNFFDWWFLGAGVSLVLIIILFALGVFNSLVPYIT